MGQFTHFLLSVALCVSAADAQVAPPPKLASQLNEVLAHLSSGHSPTPDEITAAQTLNPMPSAAEVREAVPVLEKVLANPDASVRRYGFSVLLALETPVPTQPGKAAEPARPDSPAGTAPEATATASNAPAAEAAAAAGPVAYKAEIAAALVPAIPTIAGRLGDEEGPIRLLAVDSLAGFRPSPPAGVTSALLAYLKRDDGVGPTGAEAVGALLQFGSIEPATASAISTYLRRGDQSADARAQLVDSIAAAPNQSPVIDEALLAYLNSDDSGLRARLILSLPQLDLGAEKFNEVKAQIATLAAIDPNSGQENLQVINAARSIATCWTRTKMTVGCPAY